MIHSHSHPDAVKWNGRYLQDGKSWLNNKPRQLLLDHAHLLPDNGMVLDVAAGVGTNGLFLAEWGLQVVAVDISEVGLRLGQQRAQSLGLPFAVAVMDAERLWLPAFSFDVILNFRFLERAAFPVFRQALKPGGLLFFETFLQGKGKIRYPEHYLKRGELLTVFANFEVLYHDIREEFCGGRGVRLIESLVVWKGENGY